MSPITKKYAIIIALAAFPAPAFAYDWTIDAHVTAVETTYTPDQVTFWVDGAAGTCMVSSGLGPQLTWHGHAVKAGEEAVNVQAALATLLTARASGRPIRLFGRNSDCEVEYMYLM